MADKIPVKAIYSGSDVTSLGEYTSSDTIAASYINGLAGEVTGTGGATVVADNVIDEANLKVSNSPTNGYALTAQSGNTGGLTWAEVTVDTSTLLPKAGGTMTGNIAHASDFTLDVGGDIILDADGGDVKFNDGGTQFAAVRVNSGEVYLESTVSDADLKIRGNDGGSTINMLSFDTSDAGKATFSSDITSSTGEFKLDADHRIRVADDKIAFVLDGAEDMRLENDGDLHVEGDVIAYSTTISDEALKYDINPVEFALDKINQLKGVSYKYKHNDRESAGLLAQDVEKVMPSAVNTKKLPLATGDDKEYKTLHYDSMTAILVEAIKELTAKVKKLENR